MRAIPTHPICPRLSRVRRSPQVIVTMEGAQYRAYADDLHAAGEPARRKLLAQGSFVITQMESVAGKAYIPWYIMRP